MSGPLRLAPSMEVDAPPASEPASGLVSLALKPDASNPRWQAGYSYVPELPTGTARTRSIVSANVGTNVGNGDPHALVETIPVLLTVEDEHSAYDRLRDDWEARTRRIMESYTSKLLERELWTGELALQDNYPNRVLANADAEIVTPVGGPVPPQVAVAILMGQLGNAGMDDGMIHVSKRYGIQLPDGWRNEQTYEDHGFVVVAGTGYPGTGPDGTGDNWMYATEIVNVRLGEIEVREERVDRATNTILYYAERVGAADFAGPVFACQVQ